MGHPTYIYSKHARWYAGITSARDPEGVRRCALVVWSPHHDECLAELDSTLPRRELVRRATEILIRLYREEEWFRQPQEIRCGDGELTMALREELDDVLSIRTDAGARRIAANARAYAAYLSGG